MSYYYNSGFNYVPFTSFDYIPPQKQVVTQPQQITVKETPQKESSSLNKDLLWAGITGLAVLGTYLVTRGHYKAKIPTQAVPNGTASQATGRVAQETAEQVGQQAAKPIPESVNTFLGSYKPFNGVENAAEGVMPKITQVGSRTRAEFLATVNGEQVKDIVIFNDKGEAVSRFLETTKPNDRNGVDRVRQAFRLNSNGEQELVQTSTRRKGDMVARRNRQDVVLNTISDDVEIVNHGVNKIPDELPNGDINANSNVAKVRIFRSYDKTSDRLVHTYTDRNYINSDGNPIFGAFTNERYFAYDNDGKLVGILENNPKKAWMERDYAYHVVDNGNIINQSPANDFDEAIIRLGGTYNYTDGKIHHTLTDDVFANFRDYYSSRQFKPSA